MCIYYYILYISPCLNGRKVKVQGPFLDKLLFCNWAWPLFVHSGWMLKSLVKICQNIISVFRWNFHSNPTWRPIPAIPGYTHTAHTCADFLSKSLGLGWSRRKIRDLDSGLCIYLYVLVLERTCDPCAVMNDTHAYWAIWVVLICWVTCCSLPTKLFLASRYKQTSMNHIWKILRWNLPATNVIVGRDRMGWIYFKKSHHQPLILSVYPKSNIPLTNIIYI